MYRYYRWNILVLCVYAIMLNKSTYQFINVHCIILYCLYPPAETVYMIADLKCIQTLILW